MGDDYDVFISYSGKDTDWVHSVLIPRLVAGQLRVKTQDTFPLGRPALDNMDDAVVKSRFTILVLTPEWLTSEFTRYEWRIARDKAIRERKETVLPVLLRPVDDLPPGLRDITYAELFHPSTFESQLQRLISEIGPPAGSLKTPAHEAADNLRVLRQPEGASPVRSALAVAQKALSETSTRILLLADLKKFHDLLHQLQAWYDVVAPQLNAAMHDDAALADLLVHADGLESIIRDLRNAARDTGVDARALTWIADLAGAHTMLADSIGKADSRRIKSVGRTIDGVLGIQPSVMNALMRKSVEDLPLDELDATVQAVLAEAERIGAPAPDVIRLASSLGTLQELTYNVAARVEVHAVWQTADNELRLAEKSLKTGVDDLLDDWSRVRGKLECVLREGEEWTADVAAVRDQVDSAIASASPPAINVAVRRLRGNAKRWFIKLDTSLRHECDELRMVWVHLRIPEGSA